MTRIFFLSHGNLARGRYATSPGLYHNYSLAGTSGCGRGGSVMISTIIHGGVGSPKCVADLAISAGSTALIKALPNKAFAKLSSIGRDDAG